MVRVRVSPDGAWRETADWDVLILGGAAAGVKVSEDGDRVVVGSGSLTAEIDRATGAIRFVTAEGVEIAADAGAGAVSWNEGRVRVCKRRHPEERHSGFGERATLDQTAGTKTFWNVNARQYGPHTDEMYCSVPVCLAHRPGVVYGFVLNTPGWARITGDRDAETWSAEVAGRELDYVVVHGDDPAQVLERLTALIGRIELPPRWAIGYHQSHWGYDSAARLRDVAGEFARRRLPCDAIHLDISYMHGHRVFTWDTKRFPDPAGLISELGQRGMQCVAIVDPGVKLEPGNPVYDGGLGRDAFVRDAGGEQVTGYVWPGRCVFPDFLRPDVRAWWADLHAALVGPGVAGIWNDMNEPAIYDGPVGAEIVASVVEMPGDAVHGPPDRPVRHADVHNVYGLSMARAAAEAMTRLRPDRRAFALSRSGCTGIQRYAAIWTGDNTSSWEHLQLSLPMLCNLGLSGVPFVGADIGGFWGDATPELFARWIQAGVLYPLMRGHSHVRNRPNEPWEFGAEVEAVARRGPPAALPSCGRTCTRCSTKRRRRVRRSCARCCGSSSPTRVRRSSRTRCCSAMRCWLHPSATPDNVYATVYLPAGRWYDWWSGEAYEGPVDASVAAPLDRLPLFGRGGTVVPLATVDDDGMTDHEPLTLRVFPGDGAGSIYDDDGETFDYRRGGFALRRYRVRTEHGVTVVSLSPVEGWFAARHHRLVFESPDGASMEVVDTGDALEVALPTGSAR